MRRKLIEHSLLLMMTRGLIARQDSHAGTRYVAGENANVFLTNLQSDYIVELKQRAEWLFKRYGMQSDSEFHGEMRKVFDRWLVEFQTVEESLGAGA